MWEQYWQDRGSPWDYDPGPAKNRSWSRLFAETPNYRGFGIAMSGNEEFRWHFGPMFYRGRLGDGQVNVLVVGQEGAQDESLSHRSFTGGTGGRMQHLLTHLGIPRTANLGVSIAYVAAMTCASYVVGVISYRAFEVHFLNMKKQFSPQPST